MECKLYVAGIQLLLEILLLEINANELVAVRRVHRGTPTAGPELLRDQG
jgi:hypothetical protein